MGVVTTAVLTQAVQGAGTITTASFVAPQSNPVPFFEAFAVMNASDIADPTLFISFALQIQNSSSVWIPVISTIWQGNSLQDKQGNTGLPPHVSWNASGTPGVVCRVVMTIPKSLNIGVSGRITT